MVILFLLYNFSEKASILVAHKYPLSKKYLVPVLQYFNKLHVYEFDNQFVMVILVLVFSYLVLYDNWWERQEDTVVNFGDYSQGPMGPWPSNSTMHEHFAKGGIQEPAQIVVTKSMKGKVYIALTTVCFGAIIFLQWRKDDWFFNEADANLLPEQVQEKVMQIHSLLEARSDARRHIT